MKFVSKKDALSGILNPFRELVKDSKKITFIGSVGFCTPFAELMAYVIRGTKEMVYIAGLDAEHAREIIPGTHGMQLGEETDPHADTIVVLGGLAMPKIGVDVADMKKLIEELTGGDGLIIGSCFMGIFERSGWYEHINFDYVLNSIIDNELWKR
ncbi:MAG: putative protein MTH_862 [Candidatus Argoarchaeum ethanivorans]|uniref:DUF2124 domain-containing protein n=1 Tax=Candidatus Argoarchaeum ethanivorans TaxID=2608793 RepID=A0A811T8P6_9EURY|nr:MAG: putative protein MTH_862 [Candidatus Argoarchaeum ethanivorans]